MLDNSVLSRGNQSGAECANTMAKSGAAASSGDVDAIYTELRKHARKLLLRERPGHTLQATALVNEAYLRIAGRLQELNYPAEHIATAMRTIMRRVLIDHARNRGRIKRGGSEAALSFDDEIHRPSGDDPSLAAVLGELEALSRRDPPLAKLIELRFFVGFSVDEVAQATGRSKRSVEADWTLARAWLKRQMSSQEV